MADSALALQVNPSIMTRSGGFAHTTRLPSACDLSLRRHQVTPQVFYHSSAVTRTRAVPGSAEAKSANNLSHYQTRYSSTHALQFSPEYAGMENHMRDQPSGATHNNVATCIWPRDVGVGAQAIQGKTVRQLGGSAVVHDEADATAANADGRVGHLENHMGEAIEGWPHRSDYKDTFRAPESRSLAGEGGEGFGKVPLFRRDFAVATHAIPPPYLSDSASQEPHQRISVGSGYALNNSFAYDNTEMSRGSRAKKAPEQSHYKTTFVPRDRDGHKAPDLADGTVASPTQLRSTNGYLRNGDQLPGVGMLNEGGSLSPRDYETTSQAFARAVAESPAGPVIPNRKIQRPQSVALDRRRSGGGGARRIEHTAFSRSVQPPPAEGVGSEHLKLRLGAPHEAGLHHLSTRPRTAGYEAAPACYHTAHTHRVAPIAVRIGTGVEESQTMASLARLRKSDPLEYAHEVANAPRYLSTYNLLHNDKRREEEEKVAIGLMDRYSLTDKGLNAGWGVRTAGTEPSVSNGGVRNAFETAYDRETALVRASAESVKAQGKSVAQPQGTGYTANTAATELEHVTPFSQTPYGRRVATAQRFALTSHTSFQHPASYAAALPPASGSQINAAAPIQSSYSREHMTDYIFPVESFNTIVVDTEAGAAAAAARSGSTLSASGGALAQSTATGRTVVLKARTGDLHPTVRRSLAVKESAPVKNYGGTENPTSLTPLETAA